MVRVVFPADPRPSPPPSLPAAQSLIDPRLLAEALRLGGRRNRRETLNEALAEYVERRRLGQPSESGDRTELDVR